jgi:hypothetical protein
MKSLVRRGFMPRSASIFPSLKVRLCVFEPRGMLT